MHLMIFGRNALVVAALTVLAACSSVGLRKPPNRAHTQEEAGSVHFAILSVGDWDDYRSALQPQFALSAESARAMAITPTRTLQDGFLDAVRLAATISPEVRVSTVSRSTSTAADGAVSTTGSNTEEKKPAGDSAPSAPTSNALPADLRASVPALGTDMGSDPTLSYTAATALYQEVQLLDRYIKDASARTDSDAYVVRLQVSLMPSAHRRPYDAYANISFQMNSQVPPVTSLATCANSVTNSAPPVTLHYVSMSSSEHRLPPQVQEKFDQWAKQPSVYIESRTTEAPTRTPQASDAIDALAFQRSLEPDLQEQFKSWVEQNPGRVTASASKAEGSDVNQCGLRDPIVVPLLVTDQMEATLHASQEDQLKQLSLALSLLQGNFGLGADFQSVSEKVAKTFGRDLNSLMTVARVTDNMLRVRMGAVQGIDTDYTMIPRTHNISVLVLVPRERAGLNYVSAVMNAEFRDVDDGSVLPNRDLKKAEQAASDVFKRLKPYAPQCEPTFPELVNLINDAQMASIGKFYADFPHSCGILRESYGVLLRNEIQSLLVGGRYASTVFQLPERSPRRAPAFASALVDDGKQATVILAGGRHVDPEDYLSQRLQLTRVLRAADLDKKIAELTDQLVLLPTGADTDPSRTRLNLTYPSLKALGITIKPSGQLLQSQSGLQSDLAIATARADESPTPGPGFKLKVGATSLWPSAERHATLNLSFELGPEAPVAPKVVFDVVGADIQSADCDSSCVRNSGLYEITKSGHVSLGLVNVGSQVRISAQGIKGSKAVTFDIPVAIGSHDNVRAGADRAPSH